MAGHPSSEILIVAQAQDADGEETELLVPPEGEDAAGGIADDAAHESETGEIGHEESTFPPFDPEYFGSQLLWLALTFGALYLLMSKVALPRIGEILEVRRDRVEGDLAEAERLRRQTDQAIEAYETELAEARKKAHGIAEENRAAVKAELDGIRAGIERELSETMAAAEARIEETKAEALKNVDEIAVETALAVVSRIAGEVSAAEAREAVDRVVKG